VLSIFLIAGWSSPVARQAHNLKVVSSNLAPATNICKAFSALAKTQKIRGAALVPQRTELSL